MSHIYQDKKILNRIKRLQGQLKALEQAVQQPETSCIAVLQQVAAAKGAMGGLMNELIESHLRQHVITDETAINEEELASFLAILKRYN